MKIVITLRNTTTPKYKGILFHFGSFDFHKETFQKDEYVLSTSSNDKHLLITTILKFYSRCNMFNISQINFPVSPEFESIRHTRCEKLMNAGRISFSEFRNKCYYKYPYIYRGELRNV